MLFDQICAKTVSFSSKPFGFRYSVPKDANGYPMIVYIENQLLHQKGIRSGMVLKVVNGQEIKPSFAKQKVHQMIKHADLPARITFSYSSSFKDRLVESLLSYFSSIAEVAFAKFCYPLTSTILDFLKPVQDIRRTRKIVNMSYSNLINLVATVDSTENITLWEYQELKRQKKAYTPLWSITFNCSVRSVCWDSNGNLIAGLSSKKTCII
eukprot:UN34104